jgi:hypothetical protein
MFLYILTHQLPVTSLSLQLLRKFAISCRHFTHKKDWK